MSKNTQVLLAARPAGRPTPSDFRIVETAIPEPAEGEVLLKILYLSLDPYMRGRMNAGRSYAKPVEIGAVMEGGTVARVVRSRHPISATAISCSPLRLAELCAVARCGPAQARSIGGASIDGTRHSRHARLYRLCGTADNRQAEAR